MSSAEPAAKKRVVVSFGIGSPSQVQSFPRKREGAFTLEVQRWCKHKRGLRGGSRSGGICVECGCSGGRRPGGGRRAKRRGQFCGAGGGACVRWRFRCPPSAKVCGRRRRRWGGRGAG